MDGKSKLAERMRFLKCRLSWVGRMKSQDIQLAFQVSASQASRIIGEFIKINSHLLKDTRKSLRSYEAIDDVDDDMEASDFLSLIAHQNAEQGIVSSDRAWFPEIHFDDISSTMQPNVAKALVKELVHAIVRKRPLLIGYNSRNKNSEFMFSPNSFFSYSGRYYIRGFHHSKEEFVDLKLSRCVNFRILNDNNNFMGRHKDKDASRKISLRFRLNPNLPAAVKESLLNEWSIEPGSHIEIKCIKFMEYYVKKEMTRVRAIDEKLSMSFWLEDNDL